MESNELKRKTKEIRNNIEEMELFLWVSKCNKKVQVKEIISYYEKLKEVGYVVIENILIYKQGANLATFIEKSLDEILDNSDEVYRIFVKEDLVDMWIQGIKKNEAIKDLTSTEDYTVLLNICPQIAYQSINGDTIMFAELNI